MFLHVHKLLYPIAIQYTFKNDIPKNNLREKLCAFSYLVYTKLWSHFPLSSGEQVLLYHHQHL